MIFASLGTMNMPFVRMAKAVDELAKNLSEEVVVQTGYTNYQYQYAKSFQFCTKDEMQSYIAKASLLILQGGWGAIREAMEIHKRIVVIPRHNGTEHIHDQVQLIRKLDELGCIIGVFHQKDLPEAVKRARNFDFKQIEKGHAVDIIETKLRKWFES